MARQRVIHDAIQDIYGPDRLGYPLIVESIKIPKNIYSQNYIPQMSSYPNIVRIIEDTSDSSYIISILDNNYEIQVSCVWNGILARKKIIDRHGKLKTVNMFPKEQGFYDKVHYNKIYSFRKKGSEKCIFKIVFKTDNYESKFERCQTQHHQQSISMQQKISPQKSISMPQKISPQESKRRQDFITRVRRLFGLS